MNTLRSFLSAIPFTPVYEGEVNDDPPPNSDSQNQDSATGDGNNNNQDKDKGGKNKVKFDPAQQAYVNSLLAEERRKAQAKNDQLITQLETQRNRADTTEAEKAQIAERIEQLRTEFATKEELAQKDTAKKLSEAEKKAKDKEVESKTWRKRFEETIVNNALTTAAAKYKAFNVDQVVTILKAKTNLVEVVDDKGKPTGEFQPRVKLPSKDKDGNAITLDLPVTDAVKQMTEMPDEYGNLFESGVVGGLGGGNNPRAGKGGQPNPATMSTAEYIAYRRKQRTGK